MCSVSLILQLIGGCERFLNDTENEVHKKLFTELFDVIIIHVADMCTFGVAKMVNNPSTIWMNTAFMPDHMAHYSGELLNICDEVTDVLGPFTKEL